MNTLRVIVLKKCRNINKNETRVNQYIYHRITTMIWKKPLVLREVVGERLLVRLGISISYNTQENKNLDLQNNKDPQNNINLQVKAIQNTQQAKQNIVLPTIHNNQFNNIKRRKRIKRTDHYNQLTLIRKRRAFFL